MNKQKHEIHLNSHIENVGSDALQSEVQKSSALSRRAFRVGELDHNTDFIENFRELVCGLALNNGVKADTVWRRYKKFYELSSLYCLRFGNFEHPPIIRPLWDAFLSFESGSESSNEHPLMFKENIYSWGPQ